MGLVDWEVKVKGLEVTRYKDTRGCGAEKYKLLIEAARRQKKPAKALRDECLLRFLHDLGLRRKEVIGIDIEDLQGDRVAILGKGRDDKEYITLTKTLQNLLLELVNGKTGGPLFVGLHGDSKGNRLSNEGLHRTIKDLAKRAGLDSSTIHAHGLRHTAITTLLDKGVSIRDVRRFSRHKDINTVLIYDDNHQDVAGELSELLSDDT